MANQDAVIESLIVLCAFYPKNNLPKATISAYETALADIPHDLLLVTVNDLGSTSVFFPTAAEIRARAFTLLEEANNVPTKHEAWFEVVRWMRSSYSNMEPRFSHPIIGLALKGTGGWYSIMRSSNLISERKQFLDSFEAILERKRREARMLKETKTFMDRLKDSTGLPLTMDKVEGVLSANLVEDDRDAIDYF